MSNKYKNKVMIEGIMDELSVSVATQKTDYYYMIIILRGLLII